MSIHHRGEQRSTKERYTILSITPFITQTGIQTPCNKKSYYNVFKLNKTTINFLQRISVIHHNKKAERTFNNIRSCVNKTLCHIIPVEHHTNTSIPINHINNWNMISYTVLS